jgi:signal transduction histidine kinase
MSDLFAGDAAPGAAPTDPATSPPTLDGCRAALKALQREQEVLAHGISHDLRAPLRAIDSFGALLAGNPSLDDTARAHLARVRAASARMGGLIDALLELSRVGRAPLRPAAVDLGLLAEWAGAELQEAEPGRAARIHVAPGLRAVGDERLLKALFGQLLDNAWKFSAGRDCVDVRVEGHRADGRLHVSVRDRGCGFDMRYAHKVFEPFQRLLGPEQGGGNGIGLAIAQRIVERHGGRLRAESEPGVGSCFGFDLPAAPSSA